MNKRIIAQQVSSRFRDINVFESGKFTHTDREKRYLTWKNFDITHDVDFSWLVSGGLSIKSYLDKNPNLEMEQVVERYHACLRSCRAVGQDMSKNKLYDIIPEFLTKQYLEVVNEITKKAWKNPVVSPEEYETLKNNHIISLMCSQNELEFNAEWVSENSHISRLRKFMANKARKKIKYDIFGTRTGRFATSKTSFPILSLDKSFRSLLVPRNDMFAVFDYNAAEIRTLLALSEIEQPSEDIHEWNRINVLRRSTTRDECKQQFFAWLYNPAATGPFDSVYDRTRVLNNHWNDVGYVHTPFGRKIQTTEKLSLNYLLQSCTNDAIMESLVRAYKNLPKFKGSLAFVIHDSVVLDCKREDASLLEEFKSQLEQTRFGKYRCSFHIGKDFGNLRRIA